MPSLWKALRRSLYRHSPYRVIEDVEFMLPNGLVRTYALKKEGEVATVFALTTSGQVILARQYRPGPDRVLDELPGGGVEPDEAGARAAARELEEETGYRPGQLIFLGSPLDCAYSTMVRHAYIALDCELAGPQRLDSTEEIEVVLKSVPEFYEQLTAGLCTDLEVGWMALAKLGYLVPHFAPRAG